MCVCWSIAARAAGDPDCAGGCTCVHSADAVGVLGFDGLHADGGTIVGTVLTLVFLPALYAAWFKVKREPVREMTEPAITAEHAQ